MQTMRSISMSGSADDEGGHIMPWIVQALARLVD